MLWLNLSGGKHRRNGKFRKDRRLRKDQRLRKSGGRRKDGNPRKAGKLRMVRMDGKAAGVRMETIILVLEKDDMVQEKQSEQRRKPGIYSGGIFLHEKQ